MTDTMAVLIVEDNLYFSEFLCENVNKTGDMQVIGTAGDGKTAISMIRELEPDIVLLDIIMPKLDGLGVLEDLYRSKPSKKPLICVFTAIGGDIIVRKALELGADLYVMKPFDMDVLLTRIRRMYHEKNTDGGRSGSDPDGAAGSTRSTEQIVSDLIKSIGITPNLAGYNYLREAVLLAVEQPDRLKSVSKSIYPLIAKEHGINVRNIDRAIRCAILSAQNKTKNVDNFSQDAIILVNSTKARNNAQLIRFLAEKALLKLSDNR